MNLFHR